VVTYTFLLKILKLVNCAFRTWNIIVYNALLCHYKITHACRTFLNNRILIYGNLAGTGTRSMKSQKGECSVVA